MKEIVGNARIVATISVAGLVLSVFVDYPYSGALQRFSLPLLLYAVTLFALGAARVRANRFLKWVSLLPTFVGLFASAGLAWLYLVGLTINSRPGTVLEPILTLGSIAIGIFVLRSAFGPRGQD